MFALRSHAVEPSTLNGFNNLFPRGNAYLLWGNLTANELANEFPKAARAREILKNSGFQVLEIPKATINDLRSAYQDPQGSIIIWNAHGSPKGFTADANGEIVPRNWLQVPHGRRLKIIYLATCFGPAVCSNYGLDRNGNGLGMHWKDSAPGFFSGALTDKMIWSYFSSKLFQEDILKNVPIANENSLASTPTTVEYRSCKYVLASTTRIR